MAHACKGRSVFRENRVEQGIGAHGAPLMCIEMQAIGHGWHSVEGCQMRRIVQIFHELGS